MQNGKTNDNVIVKPVPHLPAHRRRHLHQPLAKHPGSNI